MHPYSGGWHMGWMMVWWWGLGLLLVALLVWFVVSASRGPPAGRESPEEILKRRYAQGELDRDTYLRMLADLRGSPRPPDRSSPT